MSDQSMTLGTPIWRPVLEQEAATFSQTLTPLLIVTHRRGIELFDAGTPASTQLEAIAEEVEQ